MLMAGVVCVGATSQLVTLFGDDLLMNGLDLKSVFHYYTCPKVL